MTIQIGALMCDQLDADIAIVAGGYPELYRTMFAAEDVELTFFDSHLGELPDSPERFDAFLIGGSRSSAFEDLEWILGLCDFLRAAHAEGVVLLGVCFGHQIVARALGGEVSRWDGGWNIGAVEYELGDGSTSRLIACHRDQVTKLPEGAELTATTPNCEIAGFVIADQVMTIQPHPEFTAPTASSIYSARRELMGDEAVEQALTTMEHEVDGAATAAKMVQFVQRRLAAV